MCKLCPMFLRRNRRRKKGTSYEYWTLVESVRTAKGPRQRVVAHIGKEPGLDQDSRYGWEDLAQLLDGAEVDRDPVQGDLFEKPAPERAFWVEANLSQMRVERLREFGKPYVSLALWRRLHLHEFFEKHFPRGKEQVGWDQIAFILTCGRFCEQASELALAERWYKNTALEDLLGVPAEAVYDNRLYRGLDKLLDSREALFTHLRQRYESLYSNRFEFLLYDVTSTYFEGQCNRNPQAQRGYSRDQRSDCKQVCIGLVVTPEGLPLAYEVFDGNRADVTTVEDIIERMEKHYGTADRIWVMDRGMVSEDNLDLLRQKKALYIVGTPKSHLKKFARDLLDQGDWSEVRDGVEVKLLEHPDGEGSEQYVLCRSRDRAQKERAMLEKQRQRLREKLDQIDAGLRKRPQCHANTERRIGRWLGRNTLAEKVFQVELEVNKEGKACALCYREEEAKSDWAAQAHGAYLLRTNCLKKDPQSLWRWYIQLTQAEEAFRCCKSDLGLRPVFHHTEHRVQAHILVCFLSLVLWRSFEMWMHACGLGNCARQALTEIERIRSMDVIVPVKGDSEVQVRLVSKPDALAAELLRKMGLKLPNRPKISENVVETFEGK